MSDITPSIVSIAGTLLGVVAGGLLSIITERQKWRHDRQEKLAALRRDGLAAALEWIEPMRNANSRASSLVMAAIQGEIDDERFYKDFPNLIGVLAKQDLQANQRAVLPEDVYPRGLRIVKELDELYTLGVRYGQISRVKRKPMAGFQECSAKLEAVGKHISQLEADLRKSYIET